MVFRDDRDALLAQADSLRVQLAETEQQLEDARRVAADAKAAGLGGDDDDADEARLNKEIARLREQVDGLRDTNARLREDVIQVDDAPPPAPPLKPAPLPELVPEPPWEPAPKLTAPSVPRPGPPPRVEPPLPSLAPAPEVFGSVIRGPAPELPPAGNPAMAVLAFLLILVVVGVFAALAFSG